MLKTVIILNWMSSSPPVRKRLVLERPPHHKKRMANDQRPWSQGDHCVTMLSTFVPHRSCNLENSFVKRRKRPGSELCGATLETATRGILAAPCGNEHSLYLELTGLYTRARFVNLAAEVGQAMSEPLLLLGRAYEACRMRSE